jgi:hypothetical protein
MMFSRTAVPRLLVWRVVTLCLVASAAAATAFAVATDEAGGATAAKRRVAIEVVFNGELELFGRFVLTSPRSIWGDVGKVSGPPRTFVARGTRAGQDWERYRITLTLKGTEGTLELRSTTTFVSAGKRYQVFTGTWKTIGGTGAYAGAVGGGPATGVLDLFAPENTQFQFLYEGFLTTR